MEKVFTSTEAVARYLDSPAYTPEELIQEMHSAADKMKKTVEREIQRYYESYQPRMYLRTDGLQKSVKVLGISAQRENIEAWIGFDKSAWHPSLFGGEGYTPALINDGWMWKNNLPGGVHIERFTRFGGDHFAERAVKRFNEEHSGITASYSNQGA